MADQQDPSRLTPAIFLDRDGVLNVDAGYTHKVEDLTLFPDVIPALKQLQAAGYKLIVVSNQSGVGRGMFTTEDVERFHTAMDDLFRETGIDIAGFYYCPHKPGDHCGCRKPKTDLVDRAIADHKIHRATSWFVGDKDSDVECGLNAGLQPVHVNRKSAADHPRALSIVDLTQLPQLVAKKKSKYTEGLTFAILFFIHGMASWPKPVNATVTLGIALILMWHAPQWGIPRLYQFRSWLWCSRANIPWQTIGLGALAVLFSSAITDPLLIPWRIWNPDLVLALEESFQNLRTPAGFAIISLHVPILEELLFRGLLFLWLARRMNVLPALFISCAVFGALHGPAGLSATIFALAVSLTYLQTGSLVPAIVLHVINNVLSMAFIYGADPLTMAEVSNVEWIEFWPSALMAVMSLPGVVWMWRTLRSYRNTSFRISSYSATP